MSADKVQPVQVDRKETNVMRYSNTYLMARYFQKDELVEDMEVETYVSKIKEAMPLILKQERKTFDTIYQAMEIIKGLGIRQITESSHIR